MSDTKDSKQRHRSQPDPRSLPGDEDDYSQGEEHAPGADDLEMEDTQQQMSEEECKWNCANLPHSGRQNP